MKRACLPLLLTLVLCACATGPAKQGSPLANIPFLEFQANGGVVEAQYNLAIAYRDGIGTPANLARAYAWMSIAKTLGSDRATKELPALEAKLTAEQLSQGQTLATVLFEQYRSIFNRPPEARDAQRKSDVNTILNAVYQYEIDHSTQITGIPKGTPEEICSVWTADCAGRVNLNVLTGDYLVQIPADPKTATETSTRYTIVRGENGKVVVAAPDAETEKIAVTR